MSFPGIPGALPFLYAKKIRALAVTSKKRVAMMAETPTLNESGVPGYDRYGWYGILAPMGTPKEVIAQLNAALSEVVNVADMKAALNLQARGADHDARAVRAFIQADIMENAKLIKLIGSRRNSAASHNRARNSREMK